MPFSLSLYLYKLYQHKVQRAFEEKNKVLTYHEIESLLKDHDIGKISRILCSAVGRHEEVDGIPYYLSAPLNPLFSHDMFKRALIADELVRHQELFESHKISKIIFILKQLTDFESNSGYVQLLAWNSLGKVTEKYSGSDGVQESDVLQAFGGSLAALIGALLYCDGLWKSRRDNEARRLIKQGSMRVRFRYQKILMRYYAYKHSDVMIVPFKAEESIERFIIRVNKDKNLSYSDLMEGLRQINFFQQSSDLTLWKNTPHADIGERLIRAAKQYFMIAGAYANAMSS